MKSPMKHSHVKGTPRFILPFSLFALLLLTCTVHAKENAEITVNQSGIYAAAAPQITYMELRVADPEGTIIFQTRSDGNPVAWTIPPGVSDGRYSYEIRLGKEPKKERPENSKGQGPKIRAMVESGTILIENSTVVPSTGDETSMLDTLLTTGSYALNCIMDFIVTPAAADQVIPDDLIVQGSHCVGFDCVNNESFGFDTVRLKENNTRIGFDDTSATAGFPANDWQITANDSASGGSSYLAVEDITGAKIPFRIEALAPTNSLFVEKFGRIGLGTALPVLNLHLVDGDTPAIRFDQDGSGGYVPQIWDVAGNEANFFIRDVTGGSKLSFRIQPGAPTNTLTLKNDGKVGIGTWSPTQTLHVEGSAFINGNLELGSSREVKNNIRSLGTDEALMTVAMLRPVKFQYKTESDEETVGFIAEEVPDLVATKSRKSLSTMDIVAVLTKVVQDQQMAIKELNKTIVQLQAKVENNANQPPAHSQQEEKIALKEFNREME